MSVGTNLNISPQFTSTFFQLHLANILLQGNPVNHKTAINTRLTVQRWAKMGHGGSLPLIQCKCFSNATFKGHQLREPI